MSSDGVIYFESMCGGPEKGREAAIWDNQLTLNTNLPNLTECFQLTLIWVPIFFIIVVSPFYFYYLLRKRTFRSFKQLSGLNIAKLVVVTAMILAELISIIKHAADEGDVAPIQYFSRVLFIVALLLAILFTHIEFRKGQHTSGVLFIFWLILSVVAIVPFVSHIISAVERGYVDNLFRFVLFYVTYCLCFVALVLHCLSDMKAYNWERYDVNEEDGQRFEQPCPYLKASYPNRLMFAWMTPIVVRGYRKALEFGDLWQVRPDDRSKDIQERAQRCWRKQVGHDRKTKVSYTTDAPVDEPEEGIQKVTIAESRIPEVRNRTLWIVYGRVFGWSLFQSGVLKFLFDAISFAQPFLLNLLIDFVSSDDPFIWKGYFLGCVLFVVSWIRSLFNSHHMEMNFNTGMRLRTLITAAVYRKALRLDSAGRRGYTSGEIANLMAVDALKMQDVPQFIHFVWAAPLTIIAAFAYLWTVLGIATLASIIVVIIVIPFNLLLARYSRVFLFKNMHYKDSRLKMMNEILSGIKVLKLYAWENAFEGNVTSVRQKETTVLKKAAFLDAMAYVSFFLVPALMGLASFTVYVLLNPTNALDANIAFVSISLFSIIQSPVLIISILFRQLIQGYVSTQRVGDFLSSSEVQPDVVKQDPDMEEAIRIENVSCSWGDDELPVLTNIDVKVKPGSLVAVVGPVGAGKTSLISAILGETSITEGQIKINGVNISGGQKQRISLARAVYQNADIYLLDDPLSAVDAHVGKHIFTNCLGNNGILKNKTRIFVTHGLVYLPQTDYVVMLGPEGDMAASGTFQELLLQNGPFADLVRNYIMDEEMEEDAQFDEFKADVVSRISAFSDAKEASGSFRAKGLRVRQISRMLSREEEQKIIDKGNEQKKKLITTEVAETGNVSAGVYGTYAHFMGIPASTLIIIFYICYVAAYVFANIWLSNWTAQVPKNGTDIIPSSEADLSLGIYGLAVSLQTICMTCMAFSIANGTISASLELHNRMMNCILRAPMAFFDTTPLGRIVNRFSKDMDIVDILIPMNIRIILATFSIVLSTLFIVCYSTPVFLAVLTPLAVLYFFIRRFYITTARQLKRIDGITRSPIFSHFNESVAGASSIRAYGQQKRFIKKADQLNDNNNMAYFPTIEAYRWLAIWLDFIGAIVVLCASMFAVAARDSIGAAMVGLSISYALQITGLLTLTVQSSCELESNIVSVERIKEYTEVKSEAPWEIPEKEPNEAWPNNGKVVFHEYATRYRPGLDLVVKRINCSIKPGEKIGIVGRTGAGKSSLTLALFRLIEAAEGNITIDDIPIESIGLHDLRSKLTIIPQDPVLFSGTLRMNLDPFTDKTDEQVWSCLELANLKKFVAGQQDGLLMRCSEGGDNLSVGQRQLVCLARALLRRTKILILDEATAAVDLETDVLIQYTIRTHFRESSVITIAHRLNTIMDYDRIMVLDKGEIREFDSPTELVRDESTIFHDMAEKAGLI